MHAGADQALDFLGRCGGALGQHPHFRRHHRKAPALLTGAGGFHRRVERQDVGLESDRVNQPDDVIDLAAAGGNLVHAAHRLGHDLAATGCQLVSRVGQLARCLCRVGSLLHVFGQLCQRAHGVLHAAGRLFGADRQILVARGNFLAGRGHTLARIAHLRNQGAQAVLHRLLGALQIGHLVFAMHHHPLRQIPPGNRLGQQPRLLQGLANRVHVQNGQRHHHQRRHCQCRDKDPAHHLGHFLLILHRLFDLPVQNDFQL